MVESGRVVGLAKKNWAPAVVLFCGLTGALAAQQATVPAAAQANPAQKTAVPSTKPSSSKTPSTKPPAKKASSTAPSSTAASPKKPAASTTTLAQKTPAASTAKPADAQAAKPATAQHPHTAARRRKRPISPRVRRMRQAFVASASLRPMAQQLLQERSLPAYSAIQAYARAHAKDDAGALAWLVVGYAHVLDKDYAKAIDPLNRARPLAGDLGDYVAYYLGVSYLQTGHIAEALATLAAFETAHPDSLLVRDAHVAYAGALMEEGRATETVALLEKDRVPLRSDVELALGRAYEAMGQNGKAGDVLSNIYYTMPASADADAASMELRKLQSPPPVSNTERRARGDLLLKARRYADAADSYRDLVQHATADERVNAELSLADALHRSGRDREARQELATLAVNGGELHPQRLYLLGEINFSSGDNDGFYHAVQDLRQVAPTSSWLEQSLLTAAGLHLVHHEYDQALNTFHELQQRFPNGARASYAHWKAAWLTLREGRNDDAKKAFEEQIELYPAGSEIPAALYWRARLAEEDNQFGLARAFYMKLSQRYRNFYYAELGRQRLAKIPASEPEHPEILDRVQGLDASKKVTESEPPADDLHLQKAELLGNGGLVDFAVRELQAAASTDSAGNWGPSETARLYIETGQYNMAIEVMKKSTPNYFALDIPDLPRDYWEALFPKPYWPDLKRYATANGLDPYLVASLIRQESEFNPGAVSRANAVGLMQLLPKTGKLVARQEKMKRFVPGQLYTPAVNLQLGTRYFKGMVDRFGGSFEYALAAYNAGSDRVDDWLGQGKYRDPQEFVESIPFTETREYVQAILRNANVYRQLYGTP